MTTDAPAFPPIEDVLPHRAPMMLLDAIVAHDPTGTACVVRIGETSLLGPPGGPVPAWVGLEYMAQCIAAHAGLLARAEGRGPAIGFLIGARDLEFHSAGYAPGQVLEVSARRLWGEGSLGAFACALRDAATGAVLAEGTVNAFLPRRLDEPAPDPPP